MNSVSIKFDIRRKELAEWYADFFLPILSKYAEIKFQSESPDLIFHEAHLIDVLEYSGIRLAFSAENCRIDFNVSDYGIGFDHMVFSDRYL